MGLAISFCEWLSGSYWRLDAPTEELTLTVALKAATPDARELLRMKVWRISGIIDAERLATRRPLEGTLSLRRLDEGRATYCWRFSGDDGQTYEICGDKEWNPIAPLQSATLLCATLRDVAGDELGRTTLRFDVRADLGRWLRNVRLRFATARF